MLARPILDLGSLGAPKKREGDPRAVTKEEKWAGRISGLDSGSLPLALPLPILFWELDRVGLSAGTVGGEWAVRGLCSEASGRGLDCWGCGRSLDCWGECAECG